MANKASILSTVLLGQPLIDKAIAAGMELDALSFIHVSSITDPEIAEEIEELCKLPITAVFTSVNAVRTIAENSGFSQPEWSVYCIGNATKSAVLEYFDNVLVSGVADDAARLASIIKDHDVMEVVFFCGDKRMDILPELLSLDEITVHEIVVYKTELTRHVATKGYDGILFFSPSGVDSFFSVNTISEYTVLFAIGNTTASSVKQKTKNRVIISETPSKEELLACAIQYFQKQDVASQLKADQ